MAEQINQAHQENLLALLAYDDKNGKLIANMINTDLFEGEYRMIAERFVAYHKKHKQAPKVHSADLFGDILDDKGNRKGKTLARILRMLDQLAKEANTQYVLDTLRRFTRLQTMKDSILKAAEELNAEKENTVEKVEEMLSELLRAREFQFDPGITLLDVNHVVDWTEVHNSEFRTGIRALDAKNVVPSRGETFLWLAPPNVGKSWALIHTGKHALMQRRKVLHISLEMAAEQVAQRYYQTLFSAAKRRDEFTIQRLVIDREEQYLKRVGRRIKVMPEFSFEDLRIRSRLRREVAPWKQRIPNLIIKRFPNRGLTMEGLRAFLDGLEQTQGFIPDMLVLDYIGIVNTDTSNHRISLGRAFEDFRAICVERNMAGVTASQVSKEGTNASLVRATHTAEDYSLIATTDVAVTISQSQAEYDLGLARLFVDKERSEKAKFAVVITQALPIGQFALQSVLLDNTYSEFIKDKQADDDYGEPRDDEG